MKIFFMMGELSFKSGNDGYDWRVGYWIQKFWKWDELSAFVRNG